MNAIHVCLPTLNRADLLRQCIASLQQGSLKPTSIHVVDNGTAFAEHDLYSFFDEFGIEHSYWRPGYNLGVAASWNHFIRSLGDIRVICNDDIVFEVDALQKLVSAFNPHSLVCPENIVGGNFFSCFIAPNFLTEQIGLFDETLSPQWAYLEDNDYARRILLGGFEMNYAVGCRVEHPISSTLKALSGSEMQAHHQKFEAAQSRYQQKWGGLPGQESFKTAYNK